MLPLPVLPIVEAQAGEQQELGHMPMDLLSPGWEAQIVWQQAAGDVEEQAPAGDQGQEHV